MALAFMIMANMDNVSATSVIGLKVVVINILPIFEVQHLVRGNLVIVLRIFSDRFPARH
jgi:hypothetical protein